MSEPTDATPGWGPAPSHTPGYGAPAPVPDPRTTSQPQYGQPQYGAPQYGQPQYGQPQYGQPQYGQPQYGQPQYGQPQYGQPQYGQPQYGQPSGHVPPPVQRGIVPLRPLSLGEIFDGAFRSVRANPRVMFGFTAVVVAVATVLGAITQVVLLPTISGWMSVGTEGLDPITAGSLTDSSALFVGMLGYLPWMLLAQGVLTGILTVSVSRSVTGQQASVGELWRNHWRHVLQLTGLGLLYMLGSLLVVGLLVGATVGLAASGQVGLAVVVGLLAAAVVSVGSVWLQIRVLLVPPALTLEGRGAWASVTRGWRLSRGSFWRLLGIYLLAQVIMQVVSQIVLTPITWVAMATVTGSRPWIGVVALALGYAAVFTLTIVFTSAVVALLYVDVRIRREGLDVELSRAAEQAAAAQAPTGWRV